MGKQTPETKIKSACLHYLARRGVLAWNNPTGCVRVAPDRWIHFGLKGGSDILGCLPGGRILCVECKAGHGRLSPEQRQFLETVRGLGGLALVVRSWKELDAALRGAGYAAEDMPLFFDEGVGCERKSAS